MTDRDQLSSSHDFDPEEITAHGRGNGRVRELSDPDAYVMLGKLASAVARVETTLKEQAKEWRLDRQALRRERRRAPIAMAGLVGAVQAVIEVLRHTGVIK